MKSKTEKWNVKDVMSYFGDYLEYESEALAMMDAVELRIKIARQTGVDYRTLMNGMRDLLKEFGHDVPFCLQYRRAK
jgi:hypothetical protein